MGSSEWTPPSLGGTYLWCDLDAAGAVTLLNSGVVSFVDADAEAADTSAWSQYNGGEASVLSKQTGDPAEGTRHLRIVTYASTTASGVVQTIAAGFGAGARTLVRSFYLRSTGNVRFGGYYNATPGGSWVDVGPLEWTRSGDTGFGIFSVDSSLTIDVDAIVIETLSITGVTCKGTLGDLAQATLTKSPWISDADAPASVQCNGRDVMWFDGVADTIYGDGAAADYAFHKAAGFTASFVMYVASGATGTHTLWDTNSGSSTAVGMNICFDCSNDYVCVLVSDGSTNIQNTNTGASSVTQGAFHIVTITWSESGGVRILVDAAAADTAACGGSASAADATHILYMGSSGGAANYLNGAMTGYIRIGAVSDTDADTLHAWMRDLYGI